jgi:Ankyrin repeats (3 copies)
VPIPTLSPQQYLDAMIQSRGYSADKHETLLTGYYNKPTPLQLASYGVYVIELVRNADVDGMQEVMDLGLSPNACNTHGESILHNICRRGDVQMLDVLLQAGCEIQVSDDNGRTPLHDACWSAEPNFALVEKILERDIRLLYMADNRGHLPLSYIRQDHWSEWLQFLESKKNLFWPRVLRSDEYPVPELTYLMPHSRLIPDPENAPSLELAGMVAGAKLTPNEAYFLKCDEPNDDESSLRDSDDDSTTSESGACHFDDLHLSWNIDEMRGVLESLSKRNSRPLAW